jgi:hypothetical protein
MDSFLASDWSILVFMLVLIVLLVIALYAFMQTKFW